MCHGGRQDARRFVPTDKADGINKALVASRTTPSNRNCKQTANKNRRDIMSGFTL